MYIIAGCNGAGKTTASYTRLPGMLDCSEFVNSDEFAKSLAPFHPESAMVTAGRLMLMKLQTLFARREDFAIETTLATRSLLKTVRNAQAQGYHVTILYFWLRSPDIAVQRIRDRVAAGGHNIPEDIVRRRYNLGLLYFFRDYVPLCDHWILCDNTVPPYTVVAEGSPTRTAVHDEDLYRHILAQAEDLRHDTR